MPPNRLSFQLNTYESISIQIVWFNPNLVESKKNEEPAGEKSEEPLDGGKVDIKVDEKKEASDEEEMEEERSWRRGYDAEQMCWER